MYTATQTTCTFALDFDSTNEKICFFFVFLFCSFLSSNGKNEFRHTALYVGKITRKLLSEKKIRLTITSTAFGRAMEGDRCWTECGKTLNAVCDHLFEFDFCRFSSAYQKLLHTYFPHFLLCALRRTQHTVAIFLHLVSWTHFFRSFNLAISFGANERFAFEAKLPFSYGWYFQK